MGDLLKGRRGLVMGVANDHSIAWGIARAVAAEGAELAFSYQGEAFGKRVQPLAASVAVAVTVSAKSASLSAGGVTVSPLSWAGVKVHEPSPLSVPPFIR